MKPEDVKVVAIVLEELNDNALSNYVQLVLEPIPDPPGALVQLANPGENLVLQSDHLASTRCLQERLNKALALLEEVHADSGFRNLFEPLQDRICALIDGVAQEPW